MDAALAFANEILKGKDDKKKTPEIKKDVEDFSFLVFQRSNFLQAKKSQYIKRKNMLSGVNMNRMTIMRQIDVSEEERKKAREERMHAAKNFRRFGV